MEASKPFWQSKTILVQIIGGLAIIVGVFVPSVGDFLKNYFSEAGSAWAIVNIILRFVSKDKVSIS